MGIYLGRLCPHPRPRGPGGQHGAHFAHQLVPQQHPVVPAPPCCPNYLRICWSWPVVAFVRLCMRIPLALCLFLGVLTSFCRRCHQRTCGQRRVMPQQGEQPQIPREGGPSGKGPTRQMPPATPGLCEELLLPKERNHQFLQLHSRLPASGEKEAACHFPRQAVPEG